MKRVVLPARPDWQRKAGEAGFNFHTMYGEAYWDETSAYEFTLRQIEDDIEDPSTELHQMCREAVAKVMRSEELMTRFCIPRNMWDYVERSWSNSEKELYGRFDLAYDGKGPAKMLEYNADTPTSLYEASSFQWQWLEDQQQAGVIGESTDQFNRIYEALTERFASMFPRGTNVHFSSVEGSDEDYGTVETMAWAAADAGMIAHYTTLDSIGITTSGQFADNESRVIGALFKLYPWEDMLRDDFASHLQSSGIRMIEPAWKSVVSNKGILPILWKMYPNHPNLLPSFWADDSSVSLQNFVKKPIFSREGASVSIHENGNVTESSVNRQYDEHQMIVQQYYALPTFDGNRPILGSWVVGSECVGLGIREDQSRITQDLSRFKPHYIV